MDGGGRVRIGQHCEEHFGWRCPGCGVTYPNDVKHIHDEYHAFCSEGCAIRHFQDDARAELKGREFTSMSESEAGRFLDWLFEGL